MSIPVDHTTAVIGAQVVCKTTRTTYRGVLVGSTVDHAAVKCDDGKRRNVPWTRTTSVGWARRTVTEPSVIQLSDEEVWVERRPKLTAAKYIYGVSTIEVDVKNIGTDEFRADLEALRAWVALRPQETP